MSDHDEFGRRRRGRGGDDSPSPPPPPPSRRRPRSPSPRAARDAPRDHGRCVRGPPRPPTHPPAPCGPGRMALQPLPRRPWPWALHSELQRAAVFPSCTRRAVPPHAESGGCVLPWVHPLTPLPRCLAAAPMASGRACGRTTTASVCAAVTAFLPAPPRSPQGRDG